MGDPLWRLGTSINYVSEQIFKLKKEHTVEIVVADWGSEEPISNVIGLTNDALAITRFIHIPNRLASTLQRDSAFGEVYALNVAARRSFGEYIGRIDQDTLVTGDFLTKFFNAYEGNSEERFDLRNSYLFAARKQIPYSFVSKKPNLKDLHYYISSYGKLNYSEELSFCFWASPVGILMMHRDIWDDIGGYDERLIYYWFMDVDLATRLIKKYPVVNIGKEFGYHFFHLEHVKPSLNFRHSHRKLNPPWSKSFDKPILNPNGVSWGLKEISLMESNAKLSKSIIEVKRLDILENKLARISPLISTLLNSCNRWVYYQVKYVWYLTKVFRNKPYL